MPAYITLYKWTDQGTRTIKDAGARFEASTKLTQSIGAKILGLYVTMGEYDVVTIMEAPNDETATAAALSIASRGNVKTTTMRAFTESEFDQIVKKLV